ncbi:hypothetical protein PC9H_002585 [Pleurotus ostreatus]|uniref:Uncharacterized protein n=1 Tax=Pleurotus ostreatus TaxID=5322 RepID=A0A8H6ZH13_PLEOS|nr:uncharacterized protein PC9H_002585 [Pleurotus ostreatus]KAF7416320.1 hypothetical protein PC9H_002585 [Pleurotus ostreatus]KAJ8689200.1 hypothetical protein PTI98_013248 [Pleurotus ostreatus]
MGNTQASSSSAPGETALASADELQAKIFLALSTIAETSKTLKASYGDEADPRVLSFVDDIGAHLPKSVGALEYARLRIHQNLIPVSDSDAVKDMPVVVQYIDSKGPAEAAITVDTDKTESAFVVPQLVTDTPSPPLEEGEVCTLTLTVDLDVEEYDERPLHLTFKAEPLADGRLPIPPFTWVVDANLRQFLIEQDQIQREKRQLTAKKGKGKQREMPEDSEEPTESRDTLPVTIVIIKPSTAPATADAPDVLPAPRASDESTVAPTGGLKFKYSLDEQFHPRFPPREGAPEGPLSIEDVLPINEGYELAESYEDAARGLIFTYQLKEWPIVLENADVVDTTGEAAAKPPPKKVVKQVKPAQRREVEPPAKEAPRVARIARTKVAPATAVPVRRSSRLGSAKAATKAEDPRPAAGSSSSKGTKKSAENKKPVETKKIAEAKKTVDAKTTVDTKKIPAVKNTRKRKAEENAEEDVQVDASVKSTAVATKKARRATITKKAAPAESTVAEKIPAAKKIRSTKRK